MVLLVTQIIILVIGLIVFFLADSVEPRGIFSSGLLFLLFWWATVTLELSENQKIILFSGLLFYLIVQALIRPEINAMAGKIGTIKVKGFSFQLLSIVAGLGILAFMFFLQSSSKLDILGYPQLAVTVFGEGFLNNLSLNFAPLMSASIGLIENRTLFGLFGILDKFKEAIFASIVGFLPFLAPVFYMIIPIFATAFGFAILHLAAYGFVLGALGWPFMMMVIWLSVYLILKDITPADVSHATWNGIKTIQETISVAV